MSNENCKCKTCKCGDVPITESTDPRQVSVKLLSLMDAPKIDCTLTESENVIYVDSLDVIKGFCGTGRIGLLDKEILINVCESDNVVRVNLDLSVNNKKLSNVQFMVKLTENGKAHIELNDKMLMLV